jgi:hypothetical protein
MLRGTSRNAKKTAQAIENILLDNHWLESKKKKQGLPELLYLIICLSEK